MPEADLFVGPLRSDDGQMTATSSVSVPTDNAQRASVAAGLGGLAMIFVGGSVAVSGALAHAPLFSTQALRYAIGCLLLVVAARATGRSVPLPRRTEWLWLVGVTLTGLVIFNIALVLGAAHAEPAVFGVAVASVPILLGVVGPFLEGRPPTTRLIVAAVVVTIGAVLVEGVGRADPIGVLLAVVVLGCEAGFTLLAIPVLPRLGPIGVSIYSTALATVIFAIMGVAHEGLNALGTLHSGELFAVLYLATLTTAGAFVCWYYCVSVLGASKSGLLTGIAAASAAIFGTLLGRPASHLGVWIGIGIVAIGLIIGMSTTRKKVQRAA